MKLRNLILLFFLLGSVLHLQAQTSTMKGKNRMFRKSHSFGGGLTSSGIDLSFRKSKIKNVHLANFVEVDFATFRHNREMKIVSDRVYGAKYFVYGKKNSFFNLRFGVGTNKRIFEKSENNGVRVGYNLSVGGNIGLVKPYYLTVGHLQVIQQGDNIGYRVYAYEDEKYNPDVDVFENPFLYMDGATVIAGSSGLFTGISETTILPGGYAKFGFNFDFSQYYDQIRSIEVGGVLDMYQSEIPVMIITKNKPFNVSLYLNFYFGNRKTH